ncbi:MAG: polysulfide reductase NrfD [Bacteroides sp.]|nr:MAG: polysulfide reductase NrfD [Bacteroides sp.]
MNNSLIDGKNSMNDITVNICSPVINKPNNIWWACLFLSFLGVLLWGYSIISVFYYGIGLWGLNSTVGWAWDITCFVWWVGIGHAGTLISAILLLFRQNWRNSINRSAEAMTIFAVICALTYILSHMGRPWLFYWALPLPNHFGPLWVNFNSPLVWDVFAISTYFSVSVLFWYIGLIPDLATIRDQSHGIKKNIYSFLSLGWNSSVKSWHKFESVSLVLAGLSTPLVISVHTIVSCDFATSVIPGWHTTIFPPYFVAGAIFSGFAMVQTLLIIVRKSLNFNNYITIRHIELMNLVILVTGSIVGVAYLTELFIAWYSVSPYEKYVFLNRIKGPYYWAYWIMMCCNVFSPQFMWSKKLRTNITFTFLISIIVNIGMWFERFVIIVTSLHRDYLPSSWTMFYPSFYEVSLFIGSISLFLFLFLLFIKFLPAVAISEVKLLTRK